MSFLGKLVFVVRYSLSFVRSSLIYVRFMFLTSFILYILKRGTGGPTVVHGEATEALLDTYGPERRPVAEANTQLSVSNWKEALRFPQALGLDPFAADVAVSMASSMPAWLLPDGAPLLPLSSPSRLCCRGPAPWLCCLLGRRCLLSRTPPQICACVRACV